MSTAERLSIKIDKMNAARTISLDQWMPAEKVAELFKIDKKSLMEGVREGRYPFAYSKPSGNVVLIYKADVEKYVTEISTIIQ